MLKQLFIATSLVSAAFGAEGDILSTDSAQPLQMVRQDQNITTDSQSVVTRFNEIILTLSDPTVPQNDKYKVLNELCDSTFVYFNSSSSSTAEIECEDLRKLRYQEIAYTFAVPEIKEIIDTHAVLILRLIFAQISELEKQNVSHAMYLLYYTQSSFMQNPEIMDVYVTQGQLSNLLGNSSLIGENELLELQQSLVEKDLLEIQPSNEEHDISNSGFIVLLNANTIYRLAVFASKPDHIKTLQEYCVSLADKFYRLQALALYLAFLEGDHTPKFIKDMQLALLKTIGKNLLSEVNEECNAFLVESKKTIAPIFSLAVLHKYFSTEVRAIIEAMDLSEILQEFLDQVHLRGVLLDNNIPLNSKYTIEQNLPISPEDRTFADEWLQKEVPGFKEAVERFNKNLQDA